MIQGTSSDAGKSFLVTALCRALVDEGINVCPFKSQNMSNNSYVTANGLEMGRAQGVQAEAARLEPKVYMNPILLKPRKDTMSEIILMGKVFASPDGKDYYKNFTMNDGITAVRQALQQIEQQHDVVVIEGAGSPAEVNLNDREIVNMRIAKEADVPVLLVTDVDRGGSLASVVGTLELIGEDKERVKGIIFNKFRGDMALFEDAVKFIEDYTGIKVVGVMPYLKDVLVESEDSLSINYRFSSNEQNKITVGIVKMPYVSNNTDIESFMFENDVEVVLIDRFTNIDTLDAAILPGTKSTISDMKYLQDTGLSEKIRNFYNRGGFVFGICGGYQMLGEHISDSLSMDNENISEIDGIGLLQAETTFEQEKSVKQALGKCIFENNSFEVKGYEIHFGKTEPTGKTFYEPLFEFGDCTEGLSSKDMRVGGTYLHNVFHNDSFRSLWLNKIRISKKLNVKDTVNTAQVKEQSYNKLASALYEHLDMEYIKKLIYKGLKI
jgi:adenosylcobyric acid synthase